MVTRFGEVVVKVSCRVGGGPCAVCACCVQSDVFLLEAVSLGNITNVVVGHAESCPGRGWYLEKIVVRDVLQPKLQWVFPCRRYDIQSLYCTLPFLSTIALR